MSWQQRIDRALDERRAAEAFRRRLPVTHGAGRWLEREGERWLNFSSNDYLGLSQHPAIIAAWQQGATRYGVGAGGSGHVSGYSEAHRALEEALADWLGYPRALLFISGFAANQALIAALVEKDDRIVADRLSHASLLEAASLSPAQLRRFTHNDPQQLAQLLAKPLAGEQLAVTEGIFSMDGDSAPLAAIHAATQNLPTPPESVPINMLVKVKGTPLADNDDVDAFDFIRTIAIARIMMPTSHVRLSAGREQMNEQTQAMCFMAGANSIFYGCKLLTTPNPEEDKDLQLFRKLGINPQQTAVLEGDNAQQQRLEQALMNPDTEEYYNAAAL